MPCSTHPLLCNGYFCVVEGGLSNVSKHSHGFEGDCYSIRHTDKGKSINFPLKDGPALKVDDLFFDKYLVPELETGGEEILFRLN